MKTIIIYISIILTSSLLYSQSSIVFDTGTTIDVGSGADVSAGTITVNGTYNGGGTFNNGPLPVELVSFNAVIVKDKVELNWQTATEVNNYGFEVQRAFVETQHAASLRWDKISFVQGSGNSNSPKNYSFTDEPKGGKEFKYRLKQIDVDGTFEYSEEVTAVLENVTAFKLEQNYPNPFNPRTMISWQLPVSSHVTLKVYDVLGNEVATLVNEHKASGVYQVEFDGSKLASGVYFYKLTADNFSQAKKLMLMK